MPYHKDQEDRQFTVIICAYTEKRWDDLQTVIDSVKCQNLKPYEIIVVIDHNPDLLDRVRSLHPDIIAIENTEERGLSGARNSGIAATHPDILAFLDDDAIAAPDWLEQIAAAYTSRNIMGVGGSIKPLWASGRPTWFPEEFDWVVGCTYKGMPTSTTFVRNLIGCNMSLRREVFDKIGGFRNGIGRIVHLPLGCEETEFCIRLQQIIPDAKILFLPSASVYHKVPASRATWYYFKSRCYAEGVSKAVIARLIGTRDGLSNERSYSLKTLPLGVMNSLKSSILEHRIAGALRAGAIIIGFVITVAGYMRGLRTRKGSIALTQPHSLRAKTILHANHANL